MIAICYFIILPYPSDGWRGNQLFPFLFFLEANDCYTLALFSNIVEGALCYLFNM